MRTHPAHQRMSKRGESQPEGRPCSAAQLVTAPGWRPFDAHRRANGSSPSRERARFAVRAGGARPMQSCAGRGFLGARHEESQRADEGLRGHSVWLSTIAAHTRLIRDRCSAVPWHGSPDPLAGPTVLRRHSAASPKGWRYTVGSNSLRLVGVEIPSRRPGPDGFSGSSP